MTLMRVITVFMGIVVVLGGVAYAGTRIQAKPFAASSQASRDIGRVAIPENLPEPVQRYAEATFGQEIPLIETAYAAGTADLHLAGITYPGRFKFYYNAGHDYYHYIEVTWFGMPIMTVNERYMNGEAVLDIPLIGHTENEPKTNEAANTGLWGEAVLIPSLYFTDPRVRWEPIDTTSATMIYPFGTQERRFTVTFDPESGLLTRVSTLRYRDAKDESQILWHGMVTDWQQVGSMMLPLDMEVLWEDQDTPWAVWHIEEIILNLDVSERFATFGGDTN